MSPLIHHCTPFPGYTQELRNGGTHFSSFLKIFNVLHVLTFLFISLRSVGPAGNSLIEILSYLHIKINVLSDTKMETSYEYIK